MPTTRIKTFISLIPALIIMTSITFGQSAPEGNRSAPPTDAEIQNRSAFRSKIIPVKYRNGRDLQNVITLLGSGIGGASIIFNDSFKTFTVRDYPENIATIEEAIKRLDVPDSPKPDIEFRIHVLMASNDARVEGELPAELNDVIKPLQSTLNYKKYSLMASTFQRTKENGIGISNKGVADPKMFALDLPAGNQLFFDYNLQPVTLDTSSGDRPNVQVGTFIFNMQVPINVGGASIQYNRIGFNTPLNIRDGEKVVVGTTTVGDKGLIVVLSAKVVK